ncbi:NAD(P)/FAD-dependent oxidoreductase [Spirosoma areae]
MRHVVILGNGIAGITAALELRRQTNDRITVISAETAHFFARTALRPLYMGQTTFARAKPYEDWFWPKNRIDLIQARVDQLDFANKTIHADQTQLRYDVLIMAVGSKSRTGGWPGESLRGVQGLYGKPDLDRMETDTTGVQRAVVVGGGLIGIELCQMLQSRGIDVAFLIREASFWNSVLPPEESELVTQHIREHRIDVRINSELSEIQSDATGRVASILTIDQEAIPAQFVGVAIGISPAIDFLKHTALETDQGILVNACLETNLPDVYAIGSCAQHRIPPEASRNGIEQGWAAGRMMGESVAKTIAGHQTEYQPGVLINSVTFFSIDYQTCGKGANRLNWTTLPDYPGSEAILPENNLDRTFFWQSKTKKNTTLRVNYRADTGVVTGMTTLGIRQRQDIWQQWIATGKTIKYVLEHLAEANVESEFFRQYARDLITQYNAENRHQPVTLLRTK